MSETNNECRCPFPTLNGHAPNCEIGKNEANIDRLRAILPSDKGVITYDFSGEMARIKEMNQNYIVQLNQQFARPDNALFKEPDFQPATDEQMNRWYKEGCKIGSRIFGVNLHPFDKEYNACFEVPRNAFIQDIQVSKDFHREAIFELGRKPYIEGLQLFDFVLSSEQVQKLRDLYFKTQLKESAQKVIEPVIEDFKILPDTSVRKNRCIKFKATDISQTKIHYENGRPVSVALATDFPIDQESDLSEMLIYENIEASPKIVHETTKVVECTCQQLFTKGHEPTCYLARSPSHSVRRTLCSPLGGES